MLYYLPADRHTLDTLGTLSCAYRNSKLVWSEKWSAGPAIVVLAKPGNWLVGALVQHSWSFAGDNDDNNVNLTSFQYFVNYNFASGWYLTSTPTNSANWSEKSSDRYTAPVGGVIG